jgi:HSP20 family protein
LRYRYVADNYTRKVQSLDTYSVIWESLGSWPAPSAILWRPPTDVYETAFELVIVMELAGVKEEDMTVTLFSDLLIVEGKRDQPVFVDAHSCHQLGIKYGSFRSEVGLMLPVDPESITAEYQNGLLEIRLKKLR